MRPFTVVVALAFAASLAAAAPELKPATKNPAPASRPMPVGCLYFNAGTPIVLASGATEYPLLTPSPIPLAACQSLAAQSQPLGGVYVVLISAACHPPLKSKPVGPLAYNPKAARCSPLVNSWLDSGATDF